VADCQRVCRPQNEWFGGVDIHHVNFEGLGYNPEYNGWSCSWGS
jgi:hypothetical protein